MTRIAFGGEICEVLGQSYFSSTRGQLPNLHRELPCFPRPYVIREASQAMQLFNDRFLLIGPDNLAVLCAQRGRDKQQLRGGQTQAAIPKSGHYFYNSSSLAAIAGAAAMVVGALLEFWCSVTIT